MASSALPRYALDRLDGMLRVRARATPPPTGVSVDWDVPIAVRDGTVLRANVFRPAGGGRWPVIMSAHPYGKDDLPKPGRRGGQRVSLQYRVLRQPEPLSFSAWTSWEAPDPAFWVANGYAVVNCDLRGAGSSDGVGKLLSREESEDYHDLIEWAGAQSWSTGRVGLNGVSYLALSQYGAAATRPPSLAAICPWEGFSDPYRDLLLPGGIREQGFARMWSRGLRNNRLAYDIRSMQRAHPLRDEFWQGLTPELERVATPMLVCGSFSDHCLHSGGSIRAFEQVRSPQRWLYTHRAGKWATYYSQEALATQLRFFDHFLQDADNGQPDVPRVRLAVHDVRDQPAEVRAEDDWPLPRTRWEPLHLLPDGRLVPEPGTGSGSIAFDLRRGEASFRHRVQEPLELTGPMALRLRVELRDCDDANLFVGVEKWRGGERVALEGSYGYGLDRVTTGWLKLSLRELDRERSRPWEPVHTYLNPQPLPPGEIVAADFRLRPSSTRFAPGDELRLVVRGRWLSARNPFTGQLPAAYVPSGPGTAILHCGAGSGAQLLAAHV